MLSACTPTMVPFSEVKNILTGQGIKTTADEDLQGGVCRVHTKSISDQFAYGIKICGQQDRIGYMSLTYTEDYADQADEVFLHVLHALRFPCLCEYKDYLASDPGMEFEMYLNEGWTLVGQKMDENNTGTSRLVLMNETHSSE